MFIVVLPSTLLFVSSLVSELSDCNRAQWSVVDYHVLSVTARTAPLKMYQSTQHLASVPTFHPYEFKTWWAQIPGASPDIKKPRILLKWKIFVSPAVEHREQYYPRSVFLCVSPSWSKTVFMCRDQGGDAVVIAIKDLSHHMTHAAQQTLISLA